MEGRPGLAPAMVPHILDGSVFMGSEAAELGLVDVVQTTDEYIFERIAAGDRVLRLHRSMQHRFLRRPLQISPLDILPHLRSWMSRAVGVTAATTTTNSYDDSLFEQSSNGSGWSDVMQRCLQVGSWVGLAHHVLTKYLVPSEH